VPGCSRSCGRSPAAGIAVELLGLRRPDWLMTVAYLLLGWTILAALGPLSAAVSPTGLTLIATGGVLYSVGVAFHLWRSLPFQNASLARLRPGGRRLPLRGRAARGRAAA
jgi:channel protein (hemolysin III family)